MDTISLCIIDRDREYGAALAAAIACTRQGFNVDLPPAEQWGDIDLSADRWDVYLVDAACIKIDALPEAHKRILILYDGFAEERPAVVRAADKYGGCSHILSQVRLAYAESSGRPLRALEAPGSGTRFLSFFGVEGGAGVSSAALGTARELSRYRGKQVLYLSMEPFVSARLCPGPKDGAGSISAYLYYFLRGERERIGRFRDAFLYTDAYGVGRFLSGAGYNPLRELCEEDFHDFIGELVKEEEWDFIVFDWGSAFDLRMASWLPLSAWAVWVFKADSLKVDSAMGEELTNSLGLDPRRLIQVGNLAEESGRDEGGFHIQGEGDVIRIDRDDADFRPMGDGVDIGLTNVFGMGVKRIADRLVGGEEREEEQERNYEFRARDVGWDRLPREREKGGRTAD